MHNDQQLLSLDIISYILITLLFSFIRILLRKIRLILSRVNLFGYNDIFTSFSVQIV